MWWASTSTRSVSATPPANGMDVRSIWLPEHLKGVSEVPEAGASIMVETVKSEVVSDGSGRATVLV